MGIRYYDSGTRPYCFHKIDTRNAVEQFCPVNRKILHPPMSVFGAAQAHQDNSLHKYGLRLLGLALFLHLLCRDPRVSPRLEVQMKGQTKEHWMELCEQAATEQDPERLLQLINEINRMLDQKQERLKRGSAQTYSQKRSKPDNAC